MRRIIAAGILLSVCTASGCSKTNQGPAPTTGPVEPVLRSTDTVSSREGETTNKTTSSAVSPVAAANGEPPTLVATAPDGTAEATFQQTLIAFQEGRLDAAYDFLPLTYQTDLEKLVHEFAEKMDAELWSNSFATLSKVGTLLKTKKALILGLDQVKKSAIAPSITPHWDTIVAGVQSVANCEISTVEGLKQADLRKLLSAVSQSLSGVPLPKFGDVKVHTISSDGDAAVLTYEESKNGESHQVEFVKVEGKWLPKSIVQAWQTGIADARARLAEMPGRIAAVKPGMLQQFEIVNGMLDQLQQAKTADEFSGAAGPLMFALVFSVRQAEQAVMDAAANPHRGPPVHLVINRELTDDQLTKLKQAVLTFLDDPKINFEMIANDGKTRCRFTSIPDAEALVAVLQKHFDGANVRLNSGTNTIQIELK